MQTHRGRRVGLTSALIGAAISILPPQQGRAAQDPTPPPEPQVTSPASMPPDDGGQSSGRPLRARSAFAKLDPFRIREASGIVASRKRPGTFWAHGDSGRPPSIVAFDSTGRVLSEVTIAGVANIDWEDICADQQGHLYIGNIGDGGRGPTRCIYKIEEPDPLAPPTGPIEYLEKYEFPYPGGKPFDMESLFARDGHLYVLAKSGWAATMYRAEVGGDGPAQLKRVTSLPVFLATGADVSADGRRLVVGSYFGLGVFPIDESDQFVDRSAVKYVGYQTSSRVEGCCFSGDDVILVGEDGLLFRVTADDIAAQAQLTIR